MYIKIKSRKYFSTYFFIFLIALFFISVIAGCRYSDGKKQEPKTKTSKNLPFKIDKPKSTKEILKGLPQRFTGAANKATPFFELGLGIATFKLNYKGSRNFTVLLINSDGDIVRQLANVRPPKEIPGYSFHLFPFNKNKAKEIKAKEKKDFEDSVTIAITKADMYLLGVISDNGWEITVE